MEQRYEYINFAREAGTEVTCQGTMRPAAFIDGYDDEQWGRCTGCGERTLDKTMRVEGGTVQVHAVFPARWDTQTCREQTILCVWDREDARKRREAQVAAAVQRSIDTQVRWDLGLMRRARTDMFREMEAAERAAAGASWVEPF